MSRIFSDIRAINLSEGHPIIGESCYACNEPFDTNHPICLIPLGPGIDPDARAAARQGKAYTGVAIPIHFACATGIEQV